MTAPHFDSFDEFWPHYVREHSLKRTRQLHFAGTSAALSMAAYGLLRGRLSAVLTAPLLGYGPAWVAHFFIEKNRPATFDYPLWSLRGDFVMFAKMLTGSMDAEVERCIRLAEDAGDSPQNAPGAPANPSPTSVDHSAAAASQGHASARHHGDGASGSESSRDAIPAVNAASLN